ncbi:YybH family protein [Listeria floridensis]|uniref:YybH family protein n=1 Tax=Listeria floridensis TaxID=1494962 RepID=UPI003B9854C9
MMKEIKQVIASCDQLIQDEKFNELVEYYTEDAVLVVKPGIEARGKAEIKTAFAKIAQYFDNSIKPVEGEMKMIIAGDTVLVLAQTFIEASEKAVKQSDFSMERRATYIFKQVDHNWLCAIDNSYGTSLLD